MLIFLLEKGINFLYVFFIPYVYIIMLHIPSVSKFYATYIYALANSMHFWDVGT